MEEAGASPEQSDVKFTVVDYVLFSLMLVASIGIGVYSAIKSRGKANTQEYLLGGRAMSPVPVALSLLGGWISAISILGNPTEVYFFGTQIATILLGCIPGCLFVCRFIIPVFYQLKLVSMNEYIELRYGSRALRKLATLCGLLLNFLYMGVCLYAPTLALVTVTGLTTWSSTLIMGSICTFYITIGGVKAVVYADVLQTLLMFGGVLAVVIICCNDLGGVANVWNIADEGGRIQFFNLDTNPFERHTLLSTFVFGVYLTLKSIGFNQTTYQRFASVRRLQIAQGLCIFFLCGLYCLWTVFFFSGLVAFATYSNCDPFTSGQIEKKDQIIPYLVMDKLSHLTGLAGIFVAAVYGGVLSTLSSCGNSVACIIWEDFLKDLPYFSRLNDAGSTNVVKLLSTVAGVISICLGLMVGKLGSIFHVANSILSAISGPLCGVFLSGIFAPWISAKGAAVGFTTSFILSVWVVIGKFVRGGGNPTQLPLSTEGCVENLANLANTTVAALVTSPTTTAIDNLLPNTTLTDVAGLDNTTALDGPMSKTIYEVSYCYTGMISVLIMFAVGSLVSLCTGPVHPEDLREGVVNPSVKRLYSRLWLIIKGRTSDKKSKETVVEEVTMKMLPEPKDDNLESPS
ncbi:sodium-coupled monocarboxylate transporter 1-like [Panulirus ornatus]|uniref:sodium-coupled monocarboxylate transporter 1-like n=1 Tax=Panulirus ornatus TaxID=150431 RepID=UPI003A864CB7